MKEETEFTLRDGAGIRWQMVSHGFAGMTHVTSGYTIDNLDKKTLDQATDDYERTFVLVREALEKNSAYCMDVEEERLACCQAIADSLKKQKLI